jgi:hypothetical protein
MVVTIGEAQKSNACGVRLPINPVSTTAAIATSKTAILSKLFISVSPFQAGTVTKFAALLPYLHGLALKV